MSARRKLTLEEWNAEGAARFGRPARKWLFLCPSCRTVQSGQDFIDLGMAIDNVPSVLGYACIGRHSRKKGCDWTLGGLFQIHTLEVVDEEGKAHPRFEFADLYAEPGYEDKPVVKLREATADDHVGEGRALLRVLNGGEEYWGFTAHLVPVRAEQPAEVPA